MTLICHPASRRGSVFITIPYPGLPSSLKLRRDKYDMGYGKFRPYGLKVPYGFAEDV